MVSDDRRYVALIGDIQASREAGDRAELQERFEEAVEAANSDLGSDPASPLTITAGDEFQALLDEPLGTRRALAAVSDHMAPRMLRFGIGYGELETPLNEEQAIGMDGPCFRHARRALERASQEEGWVRLSGFRPPGGWESAPGGSYNAHLGRMLDAAGALRSRWTPRQAEFVRTLRREGWVQKRVAEAHGVSESTVSESLSAARYREVRRAQKGLQRVLDVLLDRYQTSEAPPREAPS